MGAVFSPIVAWRKLPGVRVNVPLAVATLAVLGMAVGASADPMAERAAGLYEARRRFEEALAHADWRRDDAHVRAVADEATAFALPLLGATGALGEAAHALVRDAVGAPLGPWLRRASVFREDLLAVWLREHPDAELEAEVMRRPSQVRLSFARALVVRRPALAAGLLRSVVAEPGTEHTAVCAVALALPGALRREFASSALVRTHRFRDAYCLALFASLPSHRQELARWVLNFRRGVHGDDGRWAVAAAVLALPTAPPSLVPRFLAAAERLVRDGVVSAPMEHLAAVGPWIERAHPRVMAVLSALESQGGMPLPSWLPLRVGHDEPLPRRWALAEELRRLADERDDTVTRLALALPHRPDVEDRALELLARARPRLHAYGGHGAALRLDAWSDALASVRACATDDCLREIVRSGSTEAATRALVLLGARSLGTAATARAVVERMALECTPGHMAMGETTVFASVLWALAADCPEGLRPIARMVTALEPLSHNPASGWPVAFVARCNERIERGGR